MNDERKPCQNCKHEHAWGILRYSLDNTPLYGPRRCDYVTQDATGLYIGACHCDRFVAAISGQENMPALSQKDAEELWSATSFLNAQVPAATRMIVAKIMSIGSGDKEGGFWGKLLGRNEKASSLMERQWPEFMGFMISQLTDIRGAMTRDDSKFAHLVAHTDEIVEAMRGVAQLSERLTNIYKIQERVLEQVEKLTDESRQLRAKISQREREDPLWEEYQRSLCGICRHQKAVHQNDEDDCTVRDCGCGAWTAPALFSESARVFSDSSRPLQNEPVVTEADRLDEPSDD